jgi:hypothetical protein
MKSCRDCCGLFKKRERQNSSEIIRTQLITVVPDTKNAQPQYKFPEPQEMDNILPDFNKGRIR